MQRAHAYRLVEAFDRCVAAVAEVVRPSTRTWAVRVMVDGRPVVFEDVDVACEFLVSRWWL